MNESDQGIGMHGPSRYAVVVDTEDPHKAGRVCVRMFGYHEGMNNTTELQWVPIHPQTASYRGGQGTTPGSYGWPPTTVCELRADQFGRWVAVRQLPINREERDADNSDMNKSQENTKLLKQRHNITPGNRVEVV
jgi:hypothetical protein